MVGEGFSIRRREVEEKEEVNHQEEEEVGEVEAEVGKVEEGLGEVEGKEGTGSTKVEEGVGEEEEVVLGKVSVIPRGTRVISGSGEVKQVDGECEGDGA